MSPPTRRRLLIAVPLAALVLLPVLILIFGPNVRSRAARVAVGLPREQVEAILGPPVLVLPRTGDRGHLLCWVDQLWQVDVRTDPGGRVESVSYRPSDSAYRRTIGRITSIFK